MAEVLTVTSNIPHTLRDIFSREIIRQTQPKLRFAQFAKYRRDLSVNPGGTVRFTKFNAIARGGRLVEGVNISEKAMGTSEISITVDEFGNAIKLSEKAIQLSMFDVLQEAAEALAVDCAKVLDEEIRGVALSTTNLIYAGGAATAAAMAALPVADRKFTTRMIKDAVEALDTNNVPKFDGQYYVCIAHPHQLRQLRDDDNWIETHKYHGIEQVYRGEVGMFEGVRFVDSTQMPANNAAASTTKFGINIATWEGVIFGENAFAWAEALEVEMRDNGIEDYGRKHGIAWYAIWGFGLIEETNIFKLLSA